LAEFLAGFAHLRVALAGGGGFGGRCEWKLRRPEAGSAPTQAPKVRREAQPSESVSTKGFKLGDHTFVLPPVQLPRREVFSLFEHPTSNIQHPTSDLERSDAREAT
jgi:hypothetical protein